MSALSRISFGPFELDAAAGRLLRGGAPVDIAPRPFAVLACLAARPGQLVSKDELLDAVWGHRHVSDSVLKVAVNALRAALGEDAKAPRWIATVARRGYRFDAGEAMPAPTSAPAPTHGQAGDRADAPALIGRDDDLALLRQALAQARLVTVTGPGGVGKTRLVLAGCGVDAPPDGVSVLRLDMLADVAQLPSAVARALGLASEAGRDAATLARALAPLRLRLVLDNAEHMADALAALVPQWLAAAPGLQVLLTSQRPLRLAGERRLPLAPLAGADAVRLVVARVQALQPGWLPDAAAQDDVVALAAALDGMPLALELAAARVPLLGVAGVLQRLHARLQLLTGGPADAPDRQRTLRAALEWSVGLLPAPTQRLLENLALCVGGFSLQAAQALADGADEWAALDAVQQLRDFSLLADAGAGRWRLYDSVHSLAGERLAAHGAASSVALDAYRAWLLAHFEAADAAPLACGEDRWMAPLLPETDNLIATVAATLAQPAPRDAAPLVSAAALFCLRAGLRHRLHDWLQQLDRAGIERSPAQRRAWAMLGALGQLLPPADALAACDAALATCDAAADRQRRLYLGYHKAMLAQRLGDTAQARSVLAEMSSLLGEVSTLYERRALAWVNAALARDAGDTETYAAFWADLLAQSRAVGDTTEAWKAAMGLAQSLYLQGRLDTAIELIDRAVDEMRTAGRLRAHALIAAQAAMLRLARDASPQTLERTREAVQLLQSDGMLWWLADALSWAALWQGREADARRIQAWADALVRARGEARGPVFAKLRAEFEIHAPARPGTVAEVPAGEAQAIALALHGTPRP